MSDSKGNNSTPSFEDRVKGLSLDELAGLRPDLTVVDPAPVAEAREALEGAIDGMQVGEAAKAALKGIARESDDSVAVLLNGFLARVAGMSDLDSGVRESVSKEVGTLAEKLGARVFMSVAADEGEGDEGEGDDAGDDESNEGDDEADEVDVDASVQEALESREAFDEALEALECNDGMRAEIRAELLPDIKSGKLRGVESVQSAVKALGDKYQRVLESAGPKGQGKPRFEGVGATAGDRATESESAPAPASRFYPQPAKAEGA